MSDHSGGRRVVVLGLDCAEPSLVFDRWRDRLPNVSRLMSTGSFGELESIVPCITVPAWACMMSSRDPGQVGLYGFHNRVSYDYESMAVASSTSVHETMLWDVLGKEDRRVILVGVPPAYPPKPVPGIAVGCFLTPRSARSYTYPDWVADELRQVVGEYQCDVPHFRTNDKHHLLRQIYEMTEKRFSVIRHFLKHYPWDFCMSVEIGVDRIHHGFWQFHDPRHHRYEPGNPFENAIRDYYCYIDQEIGTIVEVAPPDTILWVVSDHGAKRMDGGVCVNEWLMREGYLTLFETPETPRPLHECRVDWSRTRAWAGGGYYGRIFLNVQGREPHGTIPPSDYQRIRDELTRKLEALVAPDGSPLGNRVFTAESMYREVRGIPPDLLVYFGNLYWRAVGTIGSGEIYTFENDTGPDDANHSQQGLFICSDPLSKGRGRVEGARLLDIAPTVLSQMGIHPPASMIGSTLRLI